MLKLAPLNGVPKVRAAVGLTLLMILTIPLANTAIPLLLIVGQTVIHLRSLYSARTCSAAGSDPSFGGRRAAKANTIESSAMHVKVNAPKAFFHLASLASVFFYRFVTLHLHWLINHAVTCCNILKKTEHIYKYC